MTECKKEFSELAIKKDIIAEAKVVGIPKGSAEVFGSQATAEIVKALEGRQIITEADLNRITVKVLKKYNKDLAYVFEIRGKII